MELLVVLGIFAVLAGMTFSSFSGLQNTVKMNEYVLTLEQDIRSVQRAAMLLERSSDEKWVYGLGIDFGNMGDNGRYAVFKWCSPFADYGNILTRSKLPAYDPNLDFGTTVGYGSDQNGYMNVSESITASSICSMSAYTSTLRTLSGYSQATTTPKANIERTDIGTAKPRYLIFESVSGRAFFYDTNGILLNFDSEGNLVDEPKPFVITITPQSNTNNKRVVSIGNLSGKISTQSIK